MAKLTWQKFENTVENTRDDFENLCRVFFKQLIFKNEVVLSQRPNNPGIEVHPVEKDGKKISFQSKYFSDKIAYKDILDSAQKTIKYYEGKVDKVYLFCNRDITETAQDYIEAKRLLNDCNIELINFCNRSILEVIEMDEYKNIASLYFNQLSLSKEWFDRNLELALEELAPRYTKGFNVKTEFENYFEVLYLSDKMFFMINERILQWKKEIKRIQYSYNDDVVKSINGKIEKIEIPSKELINSIFNWIDQFNTDLKIINDALVELQKQVQTVQEKNRELINKKIYAYRSIYYLLEEIDLKHDSLFSIINSNILIIEGEAGIGKSHLIGFEAEKHKNSTIDRTVLLLGQKLIGDNLPEEQIMKQLGLTCGFDDFLSALEAKGENDNSVTIIMLDAINECSNYRVWKEYLNSIIVKISDYKHIKFLLSIRSTYINVIFNEIINKKIENKLISIIKHTGFHESIDEAIPSFFNHHKIPITTTAYLGYEFVNPLFLKLFCETYTKGDLIGSKGIMQLFKTLAKNEEEKIKIKLGIDDEYRYVEKILSKMGFYLYENQSKSIERTELIKITSDIHRNIDFINRMLKGKILISYIYKDEENVYLSYEKFSDYLVAENIINQAVSLDDLQKIIKEKLLAVKDGYFVYPQAIGIFSALSIMASEKYNVEILDVIDEISINDYVKYDIEKEYIEQYPFRANKNVKARLYFNSVSQRLNRKGLMDANMNMFITMAGRVDNELNANALTKFLMRYSLAERDYFWTIYINSKYSSGERVYNTVKYFLNSKNIILTEKEKILYVQELGWFLSASNRKLRDDASRALVKILKDDLKTICFLFETFINVNDPYIIQRIFGIIYGAILKTEVSNLNKELFYNLVVNIYKFIFSKNEVYPDILLRDYASNIIEYAVYLGINLNFDIDKCRPPYRSIKIPKVDRKKIEEQYEDENEKKNYPGTSSIQSTMRPNALNYSYGDFGRYVFQSSMRNFKKIDIENLYAYALNYIKNELGYRNDFFTEHDRLTHNYTRSTSGIERIGKKYQWIAMYHILAKVSDHHKYLEEYDDAKFDKYKGSWKPNVRDFDPTLELINNNKLYEFDFSFSQQRFHKWELNNPEWALRTDDGTLDYESLVEISDSNGDKWLALNCAIKDRSSDDYKNDYQEVWKGINAYIIKREQFDFFSKHISKEHFHGRWFPECGYRCNIFMREHYWSPAYQDEYNNEFIPVELDLGKRKKTRKRSLMDDFFNNILEDEQEKNEEMDSNLKKYASLEKNNEEYEEVVMEIIGEVLPCWHEYLWEEQYDNAKEEAVSVSIPNGLIVNALKLNQIQDGIFTYNDKIACVDFSLVKCNADGLYIKKEVLTKFLHDKDYKIFWICMGEKFDIKKKNNKSKFYVMSSFIYYDDGEKLKSINIFKNRKELK